MTKSHKISRIHRIKLNRQGYDAVGRYFGTGLPLYVVGVTYSSESEGGRGVHAFFHFRAEDLAAAWRAWRRARVAKGSFSAVQRSLNGEYEP